MPPQLGVRFDTIVAPITGMPPCAVAWIRVSGPEAWQVAARVFSPFPSEPTERQAVYGRFAFGDDGLALPFSEGHSYTGEESVELSMHGSLASIRSAVQACIAAGARMAEPGEFTQRAFLNGRIDLSQAEAVRETIESLTDTQLRQANRNREGALRNEIRLIHAQVAGQLAAVEASVDFSEEIGEVDREAMAMVLAEIMGRLERLRSGAKVSRMVRDGYRIAIVGPPNAGKSSLLNRLLGSDRAIVTAVAGTTRDFMEERADFDGVPVVLVDTAGLRETEDEVERIGVQRAREQLRLADAVWFVYDGSVGLTEDDLAQYASLGVAAEFLANKSDLAARGGTGRAISAKTGEGIDTLVEGVRNEVLGHAPEIAINERHADLIGQALAVIDELLVSLKHDSPDDLLSVFLNDLLATLGRITGDAAEEDLLERIFHDFCVGK